jgi:predicted PurR-regulated permease PerM
MVGLGSFVPAVGSAIIWAPAGLILILEGHTGSGIGFLLYAIVFIIGMENFLRISLQKRMADVHPLITILGFIIGVQLFGVPGIIFGPLLLSWFLLLLEIYKDEFLHPAGGKRKKSLP